MNLERALRVGDRLGGHIVQGHVDTAARVLECARTADGDFKFSVELDPQFAKLVVVKGSIAIDGVMYDERTAFISAICPSQVLRIMFAYSALS